MEESAIVKDIVNILDSKKAIDIEVLKVGNLTIISEYFIIASGNSTTQVKALADEVDKILSQKGIYPAKVEGHQSANWILLDYSDVIVHLFLKETREFYGLSRLWRDAEKIDVEPLLNKTDELTKPQ
jgi:ribosome-associated protein